VKVVPTSPDGIVTHVVHRVLALGGSSFSLPDGESPRSARTVPGGAHPLRVIIDGHPATRPGALADALVVPLRAAGREAVRVHARDFWRAASLRLEHGRENPDSLLDAWVDADALNREVLHGVWQHGRYLPHLRDPDTDRSTRAAYVDVGPRAVLLLDGSLLLGLGLAADLTVHLALRPPAEARGTAPGDVWQLAAYDRYRREVAPQRCADVVVRVDDAAHPALVLPG
jgi:hypothetical protein